MSQAQTHSSLVYECFLTTFDQIPYFPSSPPPWGNVQWEFWVYRLVYRFRCWGFDILKSSLHSSWRLSRKTETPTNPKWRTIVEANLRPKTTCVSDSLSTVIHNLYGLTRIKTNKCLCDSCSFSWNPFSGCSLLCSRMHVLANFDTLIPSASHRWQQFYNWQRKASIISFYLISEEKNFPGDFPKAPEISHSWNSRRKECSKFAGTISLFVPSDLFGPIDERSAGMLWSKKLNWMQWISQSLKTGNTDEYNSILRIRVPRWGWVFRVDNEATATSFDSKGGTLMGTN